MYKSTPLNSLSEINNTVRGGFFWYIALLLIFKVDGGAVFTSGQ